MLSAFAEFNRTLDAAAQIRDEIRDAARGLEQAERSLFALSQSAHGAMFRNVNVGKLPPGMVERDKSVDFEGVWVQFESALEAIRETHVSALRATVPAEQYFRYFGMWQQCMQGLVVSVLFLYWVRERRLVAKEEVEELLGLDSAGMGSSEDFVPWSLDVTDYLLGVASLPAELSRMAINAVTHGNVELPLEISSFVGDLFASFRVLNLKNDVLRRRYDSIKYDVKRIEQVVYDLSLRRMLPGQRAAVASETKQSAESRTQEQEHPTVVEPVDTRRWTRAHDRIYEFEGLSGAEPVTIKTRHAGGERASDEPAADAGFVFMALADSQLGLIGLETTKTWTGPGEEVELCERVVEHANRLRPAFVIMCGDMTDSWEGQTKRRQVIDFKRVFDRLDQKIPFICVCGNHDVLNAPTAESISEYKQDYGDDYFEFTVGFTGCVLRGIVLNSNLYKDGSKSPDEYARQETWLDAALARLASDKLAGRVQQAAVFMHHPLYLYSIDESEELGFVEVPSADGKTSQLPQSYFHLPLEVRIDLATRFVRNGVTVVFSGHWHKNGGNVDQQFGIEQVITSAVGRQLGADQSGLRLVSVTPREIAHRYYSLGEVPRSLGDIFSS